MTRLFRYLLICIGILYFSENNYAQDQAAASITSVQQKNGRIEFTVTSSKPFYVGGNVHILHIGKKDFSLYKQSKRSGKGVLTFYITLVEFNTLSAGDIVWLSYGNKIRNNPTTQKSIENLCQKSPNSCWYLGSFNKQLLKQ